MGHEKNDIDLLYIMGRGHSGSTVLDAMLDNGEGIESVGELISGFLKYSRLCSCGDTFADCKYWCSVRNNFNEAGNLSWDEGASQIKQLAHVSKFLKILFTRRNNRKYKKISEIQSDQINAISSVSKSNLIIDSSKEVTRALFLMKYYEMSKIIHLIRNPESILASSFYRLKNGFGFKFLRKRFRNKRLIPVFLFLSAIGWMIGNLLAEIVKLHSKNRTLSIKFESLNDNPQESFRRISDFINMDLSSIVELIMNQQEFTVGHNLGGNHMRMQGKFSFKKRSEIKRDLPGIYKVLVRITCWPMLIYYGYRIF